MKLFTITIALVLLATTTSNSTTINVPTDQPTIQAGIDAAVDGDTVLVAPGTYGAIDVISKTIDVVGTKGFRYTSITTCTLANSTVRLDGLLCNSISIVQCIADVSNCYILNGGLEVTGANCQARIANCGFLVQTVTAGIQQNGGTCTYINNTIAFGDKGIVIDSGVAVLVNNLIFGNNSSGITVNGGSISSEYNNIYGNGIDLVGATPSSSDISVDPMLVGTVVYSWKEYLLGDSSPCINGGSPLPVYDDPDGTISDIGQVYRDQRNVFVVPDDFGTLDSAIQACYGQDSIIVKAGTYYESINPKATDLRIVGESGNDFPVIRPAVGESTIFLISEDVGWYGLPNRPYSLEFCRIEFSGAIVSPAIRYQRLTFQFEAVTIDQCVFSSNQGGAIEILPDDGLSTHTIRNSTFELNGGVVVSYRNNNGLNQSGNVFRNNNATTLLSVSTPFSGVSGVRFDSNTVSGYLLSVTDYAKGATQFLSNNVFVGNTSSNTSLINMWARKTANVYNNLFYDNTFVDSGCVLCNVRSGFNRGNIHNNIMADNKRSIGMSLDSIMFGPEWNSSGNTSWNNEIANFSDSLNASGNLMSDPLFCSVLDNNFALFDVSPSSGQGPFGIGCSGFVSVDSIGSVNSETLMNIVAQAPSFDWFVTDSSGKTDSLFEIAVGTDTNWTFAEMWNPAPFASSDTFVTYAGAPLLDGATYFLRLRVHNSLVWSDWFETSFRMNSLPSIPALAFPADSAVVTSLAPTLYAQNSSDAEADTITYIFELYEDYNLNTLIESDSTVAEQLDSTGWAPSFPLTENSVGYWRVKAFDGFEYSDWSATRLFWVNAANSAPTAFTLDAPSNSARLFDMLPTFRWQSSGDNDPGDSALYKLSVAIDSGFGFVAVVDSIADTFFTWTDSLDFGDEYWWKVEAFDANGAVTSSQVFSFPTWVLGDANGDGNANIADVTFLINRIFSGGPGPNPNKTGDVNGDCSVNIADVTYMIARIFSGGPAPLIGCAP